jgi:branched-chain amino acid aminotransferase
MQLCEELGLNLVERTITRDELYIADEVFMCGTAAEITPVREIDDRTIGMGARGPLTEKVQARYFEAVRGEGKPRPEWLSLVNG